MTPPVEDQSETTHPVEDQSETTPPVEENRKDDPPTASESSCADVVMGEAPVNGEPPVLMDT